MHSRCFVLSRDKNSTDYTDADDLPYLFSQVEYAQEVSDWADSINWVFDSSIEEIDESEGYQLTNKDVDNLFMSVKDIVKVSYERSLPELEKLRKWLSSDNAKPEEKIHIWRLNDLCDYPILFIVDGNTVEGLELLNSVEPGMWVKQIFDYHF